ncbi:MAG: hypothetical protein IPO08_22550 [Xanthomonadales bacterium]|nr:hypothetical protein [Xanthomonadales bacterium]
MGDQIVAFSGIRQGGTAGQRDLLRIWLSTVGPRLLHNGAAVGADDVCLELAVQLGIPFELWPSTVVSQSVITRWAPHAAVVHPKAEPLVRNRFMVDRADRLIACTLSLEPVQRSGTWSTVRYALKMRVPVLMITADGQVRHYE